MGSASAPCTASASVPSASYRMRALRRPYTSTALASVSRIACARVGYQAGGSQLKAEASSAPSPVHIDVCPPPAHTRSCYPAAQQQPLLSGIVRRVACRLSSRPLAEGEMAKISPRRRSDGSEQCPVAALGE